MKMRLLEVVSSSVSRMHDSTDQLSASVVNRCCIDTTHTLSDQPQSAIPPIHLHLLSLVQWLK